MSGLRRGARAAPPTRTRQRRSAGELGPAQQGADAAVSRGRAGSDGQGLPALATARRQDRTAGAGAHAQAEAVRLGATTVVRLVRTLAHWSSFVDRVWACRPATVGSTVIHCASTVDPPGRLAPPARGGPPNWSGIPWTCGVGRRINLLPATGQRYAVPSDRVKLRRRPSTAHRRHHPGTIVTPCGQRVARTEPRELRSGRTEVPCRRRRPSGAPRGEQSGDLSDAALTCEDVRGSRSASCLGPARSTYPGRGSQLVDKLVETSTTTTERGRPGDGCDPDREG